MLMYFFLYDSRTQKWNESFFSFVKCQVCLEGKLSYVKKLARVRWKHE